MKHIKLLITAMLVISPFAVQADIISYTIDFTGYNGSNNGSGTDGPFSYSGLGTDNSQTNCPSSPSGPRCARLNTNDVLTFSLTAGGAFDLLNFWWEGTGIGQNNSVTFISYLFDGGGAGSQNFGNNNNTVNQVVNLTGITSVSFLNRGTSVWRLDDITFSYDDGLCMGQVCDPVDVPEPSTLALLGIGLIGIGLARRRKIAA